MTRSLPDSLIAIENRPTEGGVLNFSAMSMKPTNPTPFLILGWVLLAFIVMLLMGMIHLGIIPTRH